MTYNIPLSSLRTFIEVSRLGSMKLTAEKMCITTGAVSQQIRQLEEHLGNKLFSRTGKKLILSLPGTNYQYRSNCPPPMGHNYIGSNTKVAGNIRTQCLACSPWSQLSQLIYLGTRDLI